MREWKEWKKEQKSSQSQLDYSKVPWLSLYEIIYIHVSSGIYHITIILSYYYYLILLSYYYHHNHITYHDRFRFHRDPSMIPSIIYGRSQIYQCVSEILSCINDQNDQRSTINDPRSTRWSFLGMGIGLGNIWHRHRHRHSHNRHGHVMTVSSMR